MGNILDFLKGGKKPSKSKETGTKSRDITYYVDLKGGDVVVTEVEEEGDYN